MKLSWRILLLVLLTTLLSSLGHYILSQYQAEALHDDAENILAKTIFQSLRDALVQDVIDNNKLQVSNLLIKLHNHNNPIEFLYISQDSKIFAHSFKSGFPRYLLNQDDDHIAPTKMQLSNKYKTSTGVIFVYTAALIPGIETSLHIGINQSEIREKLAQDRKTMAILSMAITLVVLLITFYWSKIITSPLVSFTQQLKRFGQGEAPDFSNIETSAPEIQQLADTFQKVISERQQALKTLKENEQNLIITLNSIGDAVIATDARGHVTRMNPIAEQLTGWPIDEAKGVSLKTIFPIVDASTRESIENPVDKVISTGETVYLSNHTTLIAKDGSEYQIADSAAPICDNGNILGMVLVFNDVTEQYQLREAAIKSKQRLSDAQRMTHLGNWERDLVNHTLECSQEIYRIYGITADKPHVSCETLVDTIHPEDRERVSDAYTVSVKNRTPYNIEYRLRLADSSTKHVHERCEIFYDDNDNPIRSVGAVQDITEHVTMEESLRRAQKMEAVGQLSGGIAHDFNNQLGVVIGYLDFLKEEFPPEAQPHQWVDTAIHATQRCIDLTRQLLSFSRHQTTEKTVLDLNTLISEMETIISRSITPEVEVQTVLAEDLWLTKTNSGEFQDVLLNLVLNARDAMQGSGKLMIETTNKQLDMDFAGLNIGAQAGDYIQVVISDNGSGMDKATLEHVFEPFFTTKKDGKGTGLGMAMVYGFVQRYGGYIKIYSEPSVGTTIRLYLPRAAEESSALVENKEDNALPMGTETILIVDDEADLLALAEKYLNSLGYRTLTAENAAQALTILNSNESIDLMFSDVVMPGGMNGYELAQQAIDKKPHLKVLITSGFTSKTMIQNGLSRFTNNLLSKPYRKAELAQRIRWVLDEKKR